MLKAKDAEIQRLTAERDDAIAMAHNLSADLFDAQKQRDEAREAARTIWVKWCNVRYRAVALVRWPWLEETTAADAARENDNG